MRGSRPHPVQRRPDLCVCARTSRPCPRSSRAQGGPSLAPALAACAPAGRLVTALFGDCQVVNCIAGHPHEPALASCGIDSTVKLWNPCRWAAGSSAGEELHSWSWGAPGLPPSLKPVQTSRACPCPQASHASAPFFTPSPLPALDGWAVLDPRLTRSRPRRPMLDKQLLASLAENELAKHEETLPMYGSGTAAARALLTRLQTQ